MATKATFPIPQDKIGESFVWREWFQKLSDRVFGTAANIDVPIQVQYGGTGITTYNTGDIIYSPATGALTRLPAPTSATSLLQMTTAGVPSWIVRPYGAFQDNTTQTAASINTAYAVTFDTTGLSNGVSRGTPTSRIVVTTDGVYNIQFSVQLHKTSASVGYVYIWARVSGTDVPDSAGKIALSGSQAETIAAWNYMLSMAANDYFELMWSTDNTHCQLLYNTTVSPVPAIPSVILTVQQV